MWVWLSDPRTTWFRCLHPSEPSERVPWDNCQYYCHRCTHCLEVDRAHDPFHSFPCCGVCGRRRYANGPAMTLTQVACQVARLRPGYAFLTGKSFFFLNRRWPLTTSAWWTTPMGFTISFGVQVVDVGGYEPFVWRCDWRVARFASRMDTVHLSLRHLFVCHVHRSCVPN